MVIRGNDLFSVVINFRGLVCESAASQRGFGSSCCCSPEVEIHLQLKLSFHTPLSSQAPSVAMRVCSRVEFLLVGL